MPTESLNCPNCGATLNVGDGASVICAYCQSNIRITSSRPSAGPFPAPSSPRAADAAPEEPDLLNQTLQMLNEQGKLEAIKHYYQQTGVGLKEAKEIVERMEAGLPLTPDALPASGAASDGVDLEQIQSLLAQRRKIYAIQLYREQTGVGLKEAKDAVEAIERGGRPAHLSPPITPSGPLDEEDLKRLLRLGNKIEAIKQYRLRTRVGLKEAKDAVEAIERTLPPSELPRAGFRLRGLWLLLAGVFLFVLCCPFAPIGSFSIYIRSSRVYQCALQAVQESPAAQEQLGQPLTAGWWLWSPNFRSNGLTLDSSSSFVRFATSLSGPRGSGTLTANVSHGSDSTSLHAELAKDGRAYTIYSGDMPCP